MHGDTRMSLSALKCVFRLTTMLIAGALTITAAAQDSGQSAPPAPSATAPTSVQAPQPQQFINKDYSKPRSHFPNPLAPYEPRHVPPPGLNNTPRIGQLMHDGKITLSIDD